MIYGGAEPTEYCLGSKTSLDMKSAQEDRDFERALIAVCNEIHEAHLSGLTYVHCSLDSIYIRNKRTIFWADTFRNIPEYTEIITQARIFEPGLEVGMYTNFALAYNTFFENVQEHFLDTPKHHALYISRGGSDSNSIYTVAVQSVVRNLVLKLEKGY